MWRLESEEDYIIKGVKCLAAMVIQRWEMCMELLKLAIEFVIVVAEAVETVLQQNFPAPLTSSSVYTTNHLPFVGLLP